MSPMVAAHMALALSSNFLICLNLIYAVTNMIYVMACADPRKKTVITNLGDV